jgi:glycosyltransferase involved in cell wall biosynthesis
MSVDFLSGKRVCLVAAAQYTVEVFLLHQISELSKVCDVTVFVKTNDPGFLLKRGIGVRVVPTPIERRIGLLADVVALWFLIRGIRAGRFDLVHSVTPKGGLLGMIAASIARVPVRVHTFTGQVWGERVGLMRWVLKTADRITALAATHVLTDSHTQRNFLIDEGVISDQKSGVLARGSISGVNIKRFSPDAVSRSRVRARHGIPIDALVFLFMARLTRDKGAIVMAHGFASFIESGEDAHLIVVGPDEEGLRPAMQQILHGIHERVHFEDYTLVPEEFMAAADVFCLPSYREGFGTVLINAAATGIPAIASRIYGSEEAVQEGVTGLLHEAGNSQDLAEKMRVLAHDKELRAEYGAKGQERARRDFSEQAVTAAVLEFYSQLLNAKLVR